MRKFQIQIETDTEEPIPPIIDKAQQLVEEFGVSDGVAHVDVVEDEDGESVLLESWPS